MDHTLKSSPSGITRININKQELPPTPLEIFKSKIYLTNETKLDPVPDRVQVSNQVKIPVIIPIEKYHGKIFNIDCNSYQPNKINQSSIFKMPLSKLNSMTKQRSTRTNHLILAISAMTLS